MYLYIVFIQNFYKGNKKEFLSVNITLQKKIMRLLK